MAVAADSHRDFLIPEHTVLQYARHMNCIYSFVFNIIAYIYEIFYRKF